MGGKGRERWGGKRIEQWGGKVAESEKEWCERNTV